MTEPTIYDRTGEARQALRDIFDGYGPTGADDARLVNSLLPDLLPGSPPEAKLLAAAAAFRVASMLRDRIPAMPPETAVRDVATLLANREALDARACQWVVGEYAIAMGHDLVPTSPPPAPQPTQRYGMPGVPPAYSPPPYSPQQPPPYSPPYSPPVAPPVSPGVPVPPSFPATQADVSPRYTPPLAPQPSAHYTPPVAPAGLAYVPGYTPPAPGPATAAPDSRGRFASGGLFLGAAVFTLISMSGTGTPYPAYAGATALVYVVTAILLFNSRSVAIGEGTAIGAGGVAFANTLWVFVFDGTGAQHATSIIAVLLVLAATIVALASQRRRPRAGTVPGWITVGLIAVLVWIIADNVGLVDEGGTSVGTMSTDHGWGFFSDLLEMIVSAGLLIWAVVSGPTARAVGIFLGVGAASLVGFKFILLAYVANESSEDSFTFAGWLKTLASVALIITALVMARQTTTAPPPPAQQPDYGYRHPTW